LEVLKAYTVKESRSVEPQESLTSAIRAAVPDNGIVVAGMTQIGYYSRTNYPVYEPGTYLTSSYFGNLGFAFPVALGAKVSQPERAVVAISGDGGFLYNSQELATAVRYGINAVVVVFNDNAYGNVLRDQINRFDGRSIGAELHNPDFVKLAEAYGAKGLRVHGPEQLKEGLQEALSTEAPTLIEVPVEMMPSPYV
jgi:acetolactate synthase-1/2/3 large subunit